MSNTLTATITEDLEALVSCESPSNDIESLVACADLINSLASRWIGAAGTIITVGGRPHLVWRFGESASVLLLGHFDTVWPLGTLDRWPFAVNGDRATGPGVFDMKAGIIQILLALSQLDSLDGVSILLTSDEEVGSESSRTLIETMAAEAHSVLVFEASLDGALKTVRKGASIYTVEFIGKAAHAGLDPEKGVNAIQGLAEWVIRARDLSNRDLGTTVNVTMASGGSAQNTIPDHASIKVDVRMRTLAEQDRVEGDIRAINTTVPGLTIRVSGGPNRPPLEEQRSARLFSRATQVAITQGIPPLEGVAVGGCSDGNLTAGIGVDTLDGLGAVGAHAHAEGEWASISNIIDRASLTRGIIDDLLTFKRSSPEVTARRR